MTLPQPSVVGTPQAEVELDRALVQQLLTEQHPDLADLAIIPTESGWDNAMFRLGDAWVVRLPRRQLAARLIEHEQTWLPSLAPQLPISVPVPVRCGSPSPHYPWSWSVLPWLPGVAADQAMPHADQAERFADFLRSLHVPAPSNAPVNPFRGVPLSQRAAAVEERMQRLQNQTDRLSRSMWDSMWDSIERCWHTALNTPIDLEPTWLHGDLHPRNILVHTGAISGVIDWGDLTVGDRATDLAALWMLFPQPAVRERAISACQLSAATMARAKGWAIMFGVVLLDTGLVDHPRHAALGEQILHCITQDE
jgi:aminoglycoside phosphotransferase (APT) family kinase protein